MPFIDTHHTFDISVSNILNFNLLTVQVKEVFDCHASSHLTITQVRTGVKAVPIVKSATNPLVFRQKLLTSKYRVFPITFASSTNPIVITSPNHGLINDSTNYVIISGVKGNTNANGNRYYKVIDSDRFELTGVASNGTYVNSGYWYSKKIVDDPTSVNLKQNANFIGTGVIGLTSEINGFDPFNVLDDGTPLAYTIIDGSGNTETGIGCYNAKSNTILRDFSEATASIGAALIDAVGPEVIIGALYYISSLGTVTTIGGASSNANVSIAADLARLGFDTGNNVLGPVFPRFNLARPPSYIIFNLQSVVSADGTLVLAPGHLGYHTLAGTYDVIRIFPNGTVRYILIQGNAAAAAEMQAALGFPAAGEAVVTALDGQVTLISRLAGTQTTIVTLPTSMTSPTPLAGATVNQSLISIPQRIPGAPATMVSSSNLRRLLPLRSLQVIGGGIIIYQAFTQLTSQPPPLVYVQGRLQMTPTVANSDTARCGMGRTIFYTPIYQSEPGNAAITLTVPFGASGPVTASMRTYDFPICTTSGEIPFLRLDQASPVPFNFSPTALPSVASLQPGIPADIFIYWPQYFPGQTNRAYNFDDRPPALNRQINGAGILETPQCLNRNQLPRLFYLNWKTATARLDSGVGFTLVNHPIYPGKYLNALSVSNGGFVIPSISPNNAISQTREAGTDLYLYLGTLVPISPVMTACQPHIRLLWNFFNSLVYRDSYTSDSAFIPLNPLLQGGQFTVLDPTKSLNWTHMWVDPSDGTTRLPSIGVTTSGLVNIVGQNCGAAVNLFMADQGDALVRFFKDSDNNAIFRYGALFFGSIYVSSLTWTNATIGDNSIWSGVKAIRVSQTVRPLTITPLGTNYGFLGMIVPVYLSSNGFQGPNPNLVVGPGGQITYTPTVNSGWTVSGAC